MTTKLLALIPLLPLVAAAVTSGFQCGRRAAALAIAALLGSCIIALAAFPLAWAQGPQEHLTFDIPWLTVGETTINFGFVLDPLTGVMLAMVTFIGLLIFIYSISYMKNDPRMARFFCYLSLFAAGMLGLILANSLLLLFMCWEIVGLASYLLISFWFHKPAAAAAGKKAFIVTRIGDLGLFIGLLLAFKTTGTLSFYDEGQGGLLEAPMGATVLGFNAAAVISLLLFFGAVGKSGQLPLHVWLPDAMEGPTPVSALIHAATMVAAGVFLVARTHPLFELGNTLPVVAWTGAFTALVAALIALGQYDLKRILAYSTISQLGLMMVGLGVGGVAVGMFHLLMHAFFKALLFLGAGSIIHGCHEEQDIRKMGGVWNSMRITSVAYLCGTAALVAFPFTSGFFSKDEILAGAWANEWSKPIFWIAAAVSLLTAVYMTRQCLYVFAGTHRGEQEPHESHKVMTVPLVLLAVFSLGLGVLVHEQVLNNLPRVAATHKTIVVVVSVAVALGGIMLGWLVYRGRKLGADSDPLAIAPLREKLWFDELYAATIGRAWVVLTIIWEQLNELMLFLRDLVVAMARWVSNLFSETGDRKLIDSLAFDGMCDTLRGVGRLAARTQHGFLPGYLRVIAFGAVALGLLVYLMK